MMVATDVLDLVRRWAEAEQRNDGGSLDGFLADDFVGVGPVGFVLDREAWLERFDNGLVNTAFAIEDATVREYGSAAVVVGVLAQQTTFYGNDNSGRFRITLVLAHRSNRWQLANVHIGPLHAPGPPE